MHEGRCLHTLQKRAKIKENLLRHVMDVSKAIKASEFQINICLMNLELDGEK